MRWLSYDQITNKYREQTQVPRNSQNCSTSVSTPQRKKYSPFKLSGRCRAMETTCNINQYMLTSHVSQQLTTFQERNVPGPHICITSSQFHICWGHVYFSCLISILTSDTSHCLVFCHTLQSTDRQPPWIFSSWPSHLMLWIHDITGFFVAVWIIYY